MITKLHYDKQNNFIIGGTIKCNFIDFDSKSVDIENFFKITIQNLLILKKTIIKELSDDNKIICDERVNVINALDKFLTLIFAFALINSNDAFHYNNKYEDKFEIDINISKMLYLNGTGKFVLSALSELKVFDKFFEEKIIANFKNIIKLYNDKKNIDEIHKEIIKLIYFVFALRYKIEFI